MARQRRKRLQPSAHEIAGPAKLFETVYAEDGGSYGGEIEAPNLAAANRFAIARGLNERVLGQGTKAKPRTSGIAELILKRKRDRSDLVHALHEACFLGFIGLQSGTLTARELLGDGGLIHELIHALQIRADEKLIEGIAKMAREYEGRVPGWPSPPVSRKRLREALNKGR